MWVFVHVIGNKVNTEKKNQFCILKNLVLRNKWTKKISKKNVVFYYIYCITNRMYMFKKNYHRNEICDFENQEQKKQ